MLLDLEHVEHDAAGRLDLVKKTRELQELASALYPGCRVILMMPDNEVQGLPPRRPGQGPLVGLSGIEQICMALMRYGPQMELQALLSAINSRGGDMPIETLMTHLSRNKDMFVNVSRGIWTLNVTDPAMQVRLRELMNRTR